jgi:hypothetical protein
MEKEYYYLNGETKVGPFSLEALKFAPISSTTLVWNQTLPNWVEAGTLPELESLFTKTVSPPPVYESPTPPPPSYGNRYETVNERPPMPENYLVWSILTTIFCCWILGIVAIINANKVGTLYASGDYEGAQRASADAKKWMIRTAIWGAVIQVVGWGIYILVMVAAVSSHY